LLRGVTSRHLFGDISANQCTERHRFRWGTAEVGNESESCRSPNCVFLSPKLFGGADNDAPADIASSRIPFPKSIHPHVRTAFSRTAFNASALITCTPQSRSF